ncbi:unknown [Rickettsia felis URRWXCal2]|uniref:UPF0369 protein RF_1112 n=2 Tax=Rickettsia felis TaxID=42862 RepID=Y1112_RICFE|nr:RecName: Full=UPF0369 protein RF_1112 [Rickettsia felis URRWXCal2]AAY61963.1 unknown [Rickettsia felis URRWXCal2]
MLTYHYTLRSSAYRLLALFQVDLRISTLHFAGVLIMDNKKDNISEEEKLPKEKEIGGVKGLEPTRYGDWQHKGKVTDF